jgi:hypothetical protein
VKTQVVQLYESIIITAPYPTTPRGGRYCVPKDTALRDQVVGTLGKALGPWSTRRILTAFGTLTHLYWLLIISSIITIILGYVFLYSMKYCPKALAMLYIYPVAAFMFLCTVGFLFAAYPLIQTKAGTEPRDGLSNFITKAIPLYKHWDLDEASYLSFIAAAFCFWAFNFLILMAHRFEPEKIGDLASCAFEVYKTVPLMTYQPAVEAIFKFIVFWVGISGLKIIASEGWVEKNRIVVNGATFAGLSRHFETPLGDIRFYLMAVFWCCLWAHAMEICNAFGQFLVSYEVFKYYGVKKDKNKKPAPKPTPFFDGFKYGFIYHFGSILKGASMIPKTRPARICNWICKMLFDPDGDTKPCGIDCVLQNVATCGMAFFFKSCCCGCCTKCECAGNVFGDEIPNKDGFHDVVIRSNDFEAGVKKGHGILEHTHPIVKTLYQDIGHTTVTILGVSAIATISAEVVYLFVTCLAIYWDPASSFYIADPVMVTFLAWVLSAYQAFGFMTLWDQGADALLYCYAWSRMWDRKTVDKYIPESLRFIVGFDDTENDRYPYYGRAKNNMYLRYWLPMVGMEGGPKKEKAPTEKKNKTVMGTAGGMPAHAPPGPSEPQGSWMSGYGTGFGNWGRQEQAISAETKPLMMG